MKKVMKNLFLTYVVFAVGGFSLQTGISTQAIECTPDVFHLLFIGQQHSFQNSFQNQANPVSTMKKVMKNSFLTYVVFAVGGFSLQTGISTQAIECTPDVYQVVRKIREQIGHIIYLLYVFNVQRESSKY